VALPRESESSGSPHGSGSCHCFSPLRKVIIKGHIIGGGCTNGPISQTMLMIYVGSEDFGETLNRHGETLNRHGETGNGPDAEDEHFPTTEKKRSLSYADAARGTKRYVTFE